MKNDKIKRVLIICKCGKKYIKKVDVEKVILYEGRFVCSECRKKLAFMCDIGGFIVGNKNIECIKFLKNKKKKKKNVPAAA